MTKNLCFVDSVGWIAILNADDELHKVTDTEYKNLMKSGVRFVTSTAVLNEVANALSKPKYRGAVVEFYKNLNVWKLSLWMKIYGLQAGSFMKIVPIRNGV